MLGMFLTGPGSGLYALLFVSAANAADDPQRFLKEAAVDGIAEVELAEVAQERASNDVKELANRIKQDHAQANQQLKSLASDKGAELPTSMDRKHKREKDRLAKLQGQEFDRAYVDAMIKDHKQAIREFEKQARDAKDPEVKAFAAQTLPTLKQHLEQAQQIQKDLKATK